MIIVGIDPGTNGALCYKRFRDDKKPSEAKVHLMPHSICTIIQIFDQIKKESEKNKEDIYIFIEYQAHRGASDARKGRIFNIVPLLINYNKCLDAIEVSEMQEKLQRITAKQWQQPFGLVGKWKDTTQKKNMHKQRAISLSEHYNDSIKVTLKNMDAYLIMLFGAVYQGVCNDAFSI